MIITKRTKQCSKCEEIKAKTDFSSDKTKKDGLQSSCKDCASVSHKEYYQANKEKMEEYRLKYKFGITQDEYDLNLELQDDACKICKVDASEFTSKLAVDHCHTTGELRGLLCPSCNTGLGQFRDNIEFLKEAIEYLQTSKFFKMP